MLVFKALTAWWGDRGINEKLIDAVVNIFTCSVEAWERKQLTGVEF